MTGDLIEERVDDQPESTLGGGVRGHVACVRGLADQRRGESESLQTSPPDPKSQYRFANTSMNGDYETSPVCLDKPRRAQVEHLKFLVNRLLMSKKPQRP